MRSSNSVDEQRIKTLSAGFVVVRLANTGWRYLLLRCYKLWDFPKGLIEPDETLLQAARREVEEETGLQEIELCWGTIFCETGIYAKNKVARYFLGRADAGDVALGIHPKLGRAEHHQFVWATLAEARERIPERIEPILQWASSIVEATDVRRFPT